MELEVEEYHYGGGGSNLTGVDETDDINGTISDDGGEEEKLYQKSMEFVFEVVLLSIVGVLGILGNSAAIALFSRHQTVQLKFHRLMMMLSSFDLAYIVLSIVLFAVPQISPGYMTSGAHFYVLPRALPLAQIALTGSIYSTLAITVERYLTVCHPFFSVEHKWSSKRYIVPIVIFSLLYNAPKFFELRTEVSHDAENGTITYDIQPRAFRVNTVYFKVYCIWMNFIFMGLIPFVLLIVLNSLTLRSLVTHYTADVGGSINHNNGNNSSSSGSAATTKKNEIALAKVSLTIVFIFILCHSVKWIPNLYELSRLVSDDDDAKRAWPPWVESVTHISHFLMTLNSSVNFYVYCAKHRGVVSRLFGRKPSASNAAGLTTATEVVTDYSGGGSSNRLSLNIGRSRSIDERQHQTVSARSSSML